MFYILLIVETWKTTDVPAGEFNVKEDMYNDVEYYYDRPITDCQAELFQIRSEKELCWGGYVIIGISLAVVVIIAIVIGVSAYVKYCHRVTLCLIMNLLIKNNYTKFGNSKPIFGYWQAVLV